MKFRIHYDPLGVPTDDLVIEADTIEEVRTRSLEEVTKRGWDEKHCWSEKLEE